MKKQIVTIKDIRTALFDANLDTEYREAMGNSLMILEYIESYSPLDLYFGTPEQREKIRKLEERPLDSNQISEIIHLMMYQMRNDFQYISFKPVALKFLDISEKMRDTNQNNKLNNEQKPKCNIHDAFGNMIEIIGLASKTLKGNNMIGESRKMIERATKSYDYDEALNIVNEYVELVNISKEKEKEEEFE